MAAEHGRDSQKGGLTVRAIHLTVVPDFVDVLDATERALTEAKSRAVTDLRNIVVMRATGAWERRQAEMGRFCADEGQGPEKGA